uniref:Uncharacterized protein n=1 Tax=Arundo donax TaxID=35708 RepID=A0A0A8YME9_ARUDO
MLVLRLFVACCYSSQRGILWFPSSTW